MRKRRGRENAKIYGRSTSIVKRVRYDNGWRCYRIRCLERGFSPKKEQTFKIEVTKMKTSNVRLKNLNYSLTICFEWLVTLIYIFKSVNDQFCQLLFLFLISTIYSKYLHFTRAHCNFLLFLICSRKVFPARYFFLFSIQLFLHLLPT